MLASSAPQHPDEIEQLIDDCLQGDQQAWDLIVQRYWRRVFNVAYKFVGRHDLAEDLTQDIFLKIFKALGTFDRRANFQTWLISVSRNLCIDHYRSVLDVLWKNLGAERLIFGSNWPCTRNSGDYTSFVKLVNGYFSAKGQEACERYFWKNAAEAYRLKLD